MKKVNIVVIGAGIAGAYASVYLRLTNQDFVLLDGAGVGGKLNELNKIENFPTEKSITGSELKEKLINKLNAFGIVCQKENVITILKTEEGFNVVSDVENYFCNKIILAIGSNMPTVEIKNESKYIGSGVSYCAVCDANFFKGLDVAVIGNNNVALEESIYLSNIVKNVYLVADSELNGEDEILKKIKSATNITVLENSKVDEIVGDDFGVTGIKINGNIIDVAGVFPYIGKKNATQILNNIKPNMNGSFVIADENMETNIKGLYVCGDIVSKKLKQLITALGDAATAAVNASGVNI